MEGASRAKLDVPKTNRDPVWSLCPWPVSVIVLGTELTFPAAPAAEWLKYLMIRSLEEFDLSGLIDDLFPGLDDFFFENDLPLDELFELALDIIGTVSARPYWLTLRLTHVATEAWHVLGPKMISQGGDPAVLSLAAWLDLLLFTIMESIDPEKATMFTLQLQLPPQELTEEGTENDPMAALEMDPNAFLAMAD